MIEALFNQPNYLTAKKTLDAVALRSEAINKWAPHPYNARLWQEFLYSDAGQLLLLKGYTHPARFQDMAKRKVIPASLLSKLPPAKAYSSVEFPTLAQAAKATKVLADNWGPMVAGS